MTQAFLTTSRDARAATNNRLGPSAPHKPADIFYTVRYDALDTSPKQIIPFQKVSGRRHEAVKGLDLHYNDMDAFHRLHNRFYEKGAVRFDKMYSSHDDALTDPRVYRPLGSKAGDGSGGPVFQLRRGVDPRARYTGPQLTSFEVQKQGIDATYARDIGKSGPSMIPWTRMTSRQQRERGLKNDLFSSAKMPGLHVSYKAVDFDADKVVKFIPPSHPSSARGRPSSAALSRGQRPESASSAVLRKQEAMEAQFNATHASWEATTTHVFRPDSASPPRPPSADGPPRQVGKGSVAPPLFDTPQATATSPFGRLRPQSAGPRMAASQSKWDPETCDPVTAFNHSRRAVSRNLTFSKASRWK